MQVRPIGWGMENQKGKKNRSPALVVSICQCLAASEEAGSWVKGGGRPAAFMEAAGAEGCPCLSVHDVGGKKSTSRGISFFSLPEEQKKTRRTEKWRCPHPP